MRFLSFLNRKKPRYATLTYEERKLPTKQYRIPYYAFKAGVRNCRENASLEDDGFLRSRRLIMRFDCAAFERSLRYGLRSLPCTIIDVEDQDHGTHMSVLLE